MRELLDIAIDAANLKGASYADARFLERIEENITVTNGRVEVLQRDESRGIGVRVIADGSWGFAATSRLTRSEIEKTAALACRIARSSSALKHKGVELASAPKLVAQYKTEIAIDPFAVPYEEKIDLLLSCDRIMRKVKGISISQGGLLFVRKNQLFKNSEGTYIEQEITQSGAYINATAVKDGETGERSFPGGMGDYRNSGYEFVKGLRLEENAERVAEEAYALLSAKECPSEVTTIICDGSVMALHIHETVGHPTELDRVFGTEESLAGASHLTLDKRGKFQFASPIVTITADGTIPYGLGSFGFDDEGIPAQCSTLIKDGIFTGYISSREAAHLIGEKSNGTMRADSWESIPLIRMTNINLKPGDRSLSDLIADTECGIYLEGATSPSIDDKRLNFHIGAEIGWEIKNGKLGAMIKRPSYSGISYQVWRNCDAICKEWNVWGIPGCGKGEPMQIAYVGHGTSPARFRNVKIGT
ncbi:TldD/PmbA family protein [Dehalococcoidia bacterium]|nr:TldD/PmbA family protein [Dehalococcoidia bacterium]